MFRSYVCIAVLVFGGGWVMAEEGAPKAEKPDAKAAPYPLKTCVVSGEALGGEMGEPVTLVHEGRTVKFCCKGCIKKFKADPAKYLKLLDEAEKKAKDEGGKTEKTKAKEDTEKK